MESFGARLKRQREKKGVTLDDISLSTKIGTRLLRALEDEHFDQLPGGIFNKGFVRAYARHLGLDEDQAVTDYLAAAGQTPPEKAIEPEIADALQSQAEEPGEGVARIPWGVLAGALLVVAFSFAIWGFYSSEKQREAREAAAPASRPEIKASPAALSSAPVTASGTESSTPVPAPQAAPQTAPSATTPLATSPAAAPGEFVVLIKAQDDSWLSVIADGQHIMESTLVAGSEKSIHAKTSIVLRAGNVGALDFFFNGKKLPSQGDVGEVKPLSFNAEGLEPPKPEVPASGNAIPPPQ